MTTSSKDEYSLSTWLGEFADRETERSFQRHFQQITNRQLRIVLMVWAVLLLLFAVPDYTALGATRPFYFLLTYRVAIALALLAVILCIRSDTDSSKISYTVTAIVIVGFTGFMLLFVYRPDATVWIVGVIMIQIIALLMFVPIRFVCAFAGGFYAVVITLGTRWVMGSSRENLIGLFFLLMLPFVLGAATALRMAVLQRRQFTYLSKTEKINRELEEEIDRRHKLELKLKELASTDPLTGLYNRREYEMLFSHEIERARRTNSPLSVCIVDLDHFKKVNDTRRATKFCAGQPICCEANSGPWILSDDSAGRNSLFCCPKRESIRPLWWEPVFWRLSPQQTFKPARPCCGSPPRSASVN